MRHQLSALAFVTLGLLLGLFWTGCGSGGSGDANAAQQMSPTTRIHASTMSGIVTIPGGFSLIREVTFTPSGPNDIIQLVIAEGTYDKAGLESGVLSAELLDQNDVIIGFASMDVTTQGTALPYSLRFSAFDATGSANGAYPSSTYKLRLVFSTSSGAFTAQVNSSRFRLVTLENVSVENPSGQITG